MSSDASGWRRPRRRLGYRLIALLTMFSLSLGVLGTIGPTAAQTSANPEGDNYQVWRDDEIFVPRYDATYQTLRATSYEYHPSDSTLPELSYCQALALPYAATLTAGSQMAAAAGRVTSPYYDQVMVAYPDAGGSATWNLWVESADRCDLATGQRLPWSILGESSSPTLPRPANVAGLPKWYDIATGDLDRFGANFQVGNDQRLFNPEEVVVAYAGVGATSTDPFTLVLAVLDFATSPQTANGMITPTTLLLPKTIPSNVARTGENVTAIPLSVVTGNFDGNTQNGKEIAVAYLSDTKHISVAIFRYTTSETNSVVSHSLSQVGTTLTSAVDRPSGSDWFSTGWVGSLDAAAGDFDGNGKDELSVAATARETKDQIIKPFRVAVDLKTFKADPDAATLTMKEVGPNTSNTIPYTDKDSDFGAEVQLAAGLFKYDPATGFDINRRQLALAAGTSRGSAPLMTLVYDQNLTPTVANTDPYPGVTATDATGRLNFWLAAGSFMGLRATGSAADAVWSLAITTWANNGQVLYLFNTDPSTGAIAATPFATQTLSTATDPSHATSVAPVVAYDYGQPPAAGVTPQILRGDAQYLGLPFHFVVDGVTQTQSIIQEPPKEVYWDKDTNEVVSINGLDSTYSKLSSETKSTFSTSRKSTSSFAVGADAKESVGVSAEYPGFLFGASASLDVTASFGYEYDSNSSSYNSGTATITKGAEYTATRDDFIVYTGQSLDVWRYPIYGLPMGQQTNGTTINGYLDILMPSTTPVESTLPGQHIAWYQPVQEPGNILSYPVSTADPADPFASDIGTFRVPCPNPDGTGCVKDNSTPPMYWQEVTGRPLAEYGGATGGIEIKDWVAMSSESGAGQDHEYTNKLSSGLDVSLTATGKVPGMEFKSTTQLGFNESNSWGEASTQETKASKDNGVQVAFGSVGTDDQSYGFNTVVYISKDGTWKVAYTTDPLREGPGSPSYAFWTTHFGAADPALNLPNRFNSINGNCRPPECPEQWVPNPDNSRKAMKGFFVRASQVDPISGEYPLLGRAPAAGETARLEARVYNYSVLTQVNSLKVRFVAVPLDQYGNEIPASATSPWTTIGETTVGPLAPRANTIAAIDWDTTNFGPSAGASKKTWHIHVILDPDNSVQNETYETESSTTATYCVANCTNANTAQYIDPGQNNEGWATVDVAVSVAQGGKGPRVVQLDKNAMGAIDDNGKLKTNGVQAEVDQPLRVIVKASTDVANTAYRRVQLFDGDPNKGGTLVGDSQVFVGDPAGSTVEFSWTPTTAGAHRLYAKLLPNTDDQAGNLLDDLKVNVHKARSTDKANAKGK